MSLTVSEGSGTYVPCPPGSYPARLCALIDLGTQTSTWEGEQKTAHKVLLTFEVTDPETRRDDGSAHTISRRFTASLHVKSALRKLLEAWRGKPFSVDELRQFDLKVLVGMSCMVSVIHETKGDKTFANLASVMKLPRGFAPGIDTEPLVHFDLSAPDWAVFAGLSSKLQEQISTSPEFARLTPPKTVSLPAQAPAAPPAHTPAPQTPVPSRPAAPPPAPAGSGFDDMDDDIPFATASAYYDMTTSKQRRMRSPKLEDAS